MKNPSDFSLLAIKRSKKKQYIVGIALALLACICMVCMGTVFQESPPTETPTPAEPTQELAKATATKEIIPTFPSTWTPPPGATTAPTNTSQPAAVIPPVIVPPVSVEKPTTPPVAFTMSGGSCIPNNTIEVAEVIKITDGDTIRILLNGQDYSVRYIGIDTPEMEDDQLSQQAKQANADLVMGKTVLMIKDKSEVDRFDRLLRYVIVGDTFVNYDLVKQGFAEAKDYPPDTACSKELSSAMIIAQSSTLGIWALSAAAGAGIIAPAPAAQNCDPAYPDVCIPPPPPDLDCGDISFRRFRVLSPDPHRFDGNDKDGIGCESN